MHQIAEDEEQPMIADNFVFKWRIDEKIVYGDDDDEVDEEIEELLNIPSTSSIQPSECDECVKVHYYCTRR